MTSSSSGPSATRSDAPTWADGLVAATSALPDAAFDGGLDPTVRDAARDRLRRHDLFHTLDEDAPRRAIPVAPAAPDADWLDGWEAALEAAVRAADLPAGRPDPATVAVIGLRFDRREADRVADAAEVRRSIEALGVVVAAVWPGEGGIATLAAAARAGTIVALPHGLRAARALGERTGARVVEAGLPLGLAGTTAWVRAVAVAMDRGPAGEAFVDRELDHLVPRFEWVVPNSLLHRRIGLGGDGPFVAAAAEALRELGVDVVGADVLAGAAPSDLAPFPWNREAVDLVVGPRPSVDRAIAAEIPWLETGFPSPGSHAVAPTPHLGYAGVAHLVEAIVNRLALWDTLRSWERTTAGEGLLRGKAPPEE